MDPLIVDPYAYDKQEAFDHALVYVKHFLDLNKLPHPSSISVVPTEDPFKSNKWRDRGWYEFGSWRLFVNLKKTRPPVKTPGFAWSFTGSKADLTAPGVLAHETGHHVHNMFNRASDPKKVLDMIDYVRVHEPAVSGYEPNQYETFAEAMRLFILNPNLLKEGRPLRYQLVSVLKPVHDVPWREILKHAHPKLINSLENWIVQTKP